jgi:hypothetical protein
MHRQKEGLWCHLLELIPSPERDELRSLVGRSILDLNEVRKSVRFVLFLYLLSHLDFME